MTRGCQLAILLPVANSHLLLLPNSYTLYHTIPYLVSRCNRLASSFPAAFWIFLDLFLVIQKDDRLAASCQIFQEPSLLFQQWQRHRSAQSGAGAGKLLGRRSPWGHGDPRILQGKKRTMSRENWDLSIWIYADLYGFICMYHDLWWVYKIYNDLYGFITLKMQNIGENKWENGSNHVMINGLV